MENKCDCNGNCGKDCKCKNEVLEDKELQIEDMSVSEESRIKVEINNGSYSFTPLIAETTTEIPIRYLEGAKELSMNPKGDCIDVYAYEDVFIPYMGYAMINLGFAMKLPKGMIAKLYPRSSTFKTWGIIQTNSVGIIDESYCGNNDIWHMPVQCTMPKQCDKIMVNDKKITIAGTWIKKGDKIAQFEICNAMKKPILVKVDHLDDTDRGGFGSSGRK